MLVFVIPLKSSQVSKSWEHVSKLFERCVRSVCNQTSNNFRVVVVCHEKPQIEFSHPHITYIEVDFPAPDIDNESKILDKRRKIIWGLNYARQLKATYTMNLDADDCVSKHLAEFVEQKPHSNGWFLDRGYLYQDGSNLLYLKRKDLHQWCGSCHIVRYDLLNLPERVEDESGDLSNYYCSHRKVVNKFAQEGTPIEPLPFTGAIYVLGHGDNIFGNFNKLIPHKGIFQGLKRVMFNFRPLTRAVRNEFGIYNILSN